MATVKEEAQKLVASLPEDATWDDLMYQIYVRTKIEEGIADDEAGDVVPQEEVERMYQDYVRAKVEAAIAASDAGRVVPHEVVKKMFPAE